MNEENGEQTGRKRLVQKKKERCVSPGEWGGHSGCIIGSCAHTRAKTHTHPVPFPPQLWSDALVAATLASLDMQSGPISSTMCRKWHVPPEEAQKQHQCSQPAINHASVSLRVCVALDTEMSRTWIIKLISYWLKKNLLNPNNLTWISEEWNVSLSSGKYQFLHPLVFPHQYIAVKLAANTRQTAAVRRVLLLIWSISGGVRLFPVRRESLLADWRALDSTAGGYSPISVSKNTAVSFIWQIFHQSIIKEWSLYFKKSFQRGEYNYPPALDQYISLLFSSQSPLM